VSASNQQHTKFPHSPAAFINNIAEEGTKDEAIRWLQTTWNEAVALRAQNAELLEALKIAREHVAAICEHNELLGSGAQDRIDLTRIDATLARATGKERV